MANVGRLVDIPSDLSDAYLPYEPTLRQRQKAYAFSKNSYVQKIRITVGETLEKLIYRRKFSGRKTEAPHTVNMTINSLTKTLTEGHYSCKAGISGECAHLLSVVMTLQNWILEGYKEVPANPSCTSLPQQWDKPRGEKVKGEPVTQMVIVKPINTNRKRKPLVESFHDNRRKKLQATDLQYLQNLKDCPIAYVTQNKSDVTVNTPHGLQLVGSESILNFFMRDIARSTWTLCQAIFFVTATSAALICLSDDAYGDIMNSSPRPSISSFMLNPLSTMTPSPVSNMLQSSNVFKWSNKPLLVLISLSDVDPENKSPLINLDDIRPAVETYNACGTLEFPLDKEINMPQDVKQYEHEWNCLKCDIIVSKEIEKETRDQAGSHRWQIERSCRITASNFGQIMKRKSAINEKFLKSIFQKQTYCT
ncbi:LOW QUALITY PROTEIN: hypothetical protein KUTeg_012049, partial [Tegillarca granosa]